MNMILLRVLAVIFYNCYPDSELPQMVKDCLKSYEILQERCVLLDSLPPECSAVYDKELRKIRNATSTDVIMTDLDGDKTMEMVILSGGTGSGGSDWTVMQKKNGKYCKVGDVFGTLYKNGKGLIVRHRIGWSESAWTYYELDNGKLQNKLSVDVTYGLSKDSQYAYPIKMEIKDELKDNTKVFVSNND